MEFEYEITICLGSSCFSRGNKKTLHAINNYLKENDLVDKVYFHGAHCYSNCDKGPILKVNDTLYEQVDEVKAKAIMDSYFK